LALSHNHSVFVNATYYVERCCLFFFVCFLLVIVLSVLRQITASDYPIWYLQTSLSLSLLLDYLYTKASMCLLTRYYSVVVVELSPFMLYASFVVIKCDPHYRKMFEKTYWKILHILLLETTNLIGTKLHIRDGPFNLQGGVMVFFLKKYSDSQCC